MLINTYAPPGSFGLSIIGGKTGRWVSAGQAFIGDGSKYTHAFVVVDKGQIIEAMPSGARTYPIQKRFDDPGGIRISDAPVRNALKKFDLHFPSPRFAKHRAVYEQNLRQRIVLTARELEGTPYNFADYLYLAIAHFGIKADWLRKRINDSGHMICSQLVDYVYYVAGLTLFDDDRLPMDVTPGDLDNYRVANL